MLRSMPAECAVVLTAGYGSRLFPVTAVVPKSLMPIGTRPVLHFVLADLIAAGVTDIAVVVDHGDTAITQYVTGAPEVAAELASRGWEGKFERFATAYEELAPATFTIIEQDVSGDYGTAVPARLARDFVDDRCCFYVSGDDLLMAPDGSCNVDDLANLRTAANDCWAAMQVATVPVEHADRYGIVEFAHTGDRLRLHDLKEKSSTSTGRCANISRYYLSPEAYGVVCEQQPSSDTGEVMITDALLEIRDRDAVGVAIASGHYFDCGSLDGWHQANAAMRAQRPGTDS